MDTLRQLASSLGLSSEPRPAPPTPPIQPNANDSSIPTEQPDTASARHIVTAATASNEWHQAVTNTSTTSWPAAAATPQQEDIAPLGPL